MVMILLKKMCAEIFLKLCLFHLLLIETVRLSTDPTAGLIILSIL